MRKKTAAEEDREKIAECCRSVCSRLRVYGMSTLAEALERDNSSLNVVLALAVDMERGTAQTANVIAAQRIAGKLREAFEIMQRRPHVEPEGLNVARSVIANPYACPSCRAEAHAAPTSDCSAVHPLLMRARECLRGANELSCCPVLDDAAAETHARAAVLMLREATARLEELAMLLAVKRQNKS